MCAEKENNEDFSQGLFFYKVHRKRGPLMTSYSQVKKVLNRSKYRLKKLNDFKQNPDITYFTYFKKSADLAT